MPCAMDLIRLKRHITDDHGILDRPQNRLGMMQHFLIPTWVVDSNPKTTLAKESPYNMMSTPARIHK